MVDISAKTAKIVEMIERGEYFVINRPRQYGKTTTIDMLDRLLKTSAEYFPIEISFEGIGSDSFKAENVFIKAFLLRLKHVFKTSGNEDLVNFLTAGPDPDSLSELGFWLNEFVVKIGKKPVLMIDEVDKSSNNQLFLDFLGLLREKYLNRSKAGEFTFHSVILVGVHDVKSLKTKIRKDSGAKYNSPWNIAVDLISKKCRFPKKGVWILSFHLIIKNISLNLKYGTVRVITRKDSINYAVILMCKTRFSVTCLFTILERKPGKLGILRPLKWKVKKSLLPGFDIHKKAVLILELARVFVKQANIPL